MSFKDDFERIVAELKAHPQVEVVGAKLGEPTTAEDITSHMQAVGFEPTDEMLAFYTEHNGAYLEWGIKGADYERVGMGGFPDYNTPPGVINIYDAATAFSSDWQDDAMINSSNEEPWKLAYGTTEPDVSPTVVMIDGFSMYYHSDLLLGPEPLLVVASDHGADLSCSDFLTFSQYLELVIARYGSNPYLAVGIGWSRKAERVKTIEKPTLDEIIAKVIEAAAEE